MSGKFIGRKWFSFLCLTAFLALPLMVLPHAFADRPPCPLDSLSCSLEGKVLHPLLPPSGSEESQRHERATANANGDFKIESVGDGIREERIVFHDTIFTKPDGGRVAEGFLRFQSVAEARKELEKTMKHATEVIDQIPENNRESSSTHGRVVAKFLSLDGQRRTLVRIIWVDGSTLHEILSESQQDALELEKPASAAVKR